MIDRYLPLIKTTPLFAGINSAEIAAVLKCIRYGIRTYASGQTVFFEGDTPGTVAMVLKGVVHVAKDDFWGNRSIHAAVTPGQLFAEAFALAGNRPLTVNVVAAEDSEILMMDFSKTITVCHNSCAFHNRLIKNLLEIVSAKNIALTRKIQYLSERTTREKLLSYLSDEAKRQGKKEFSIPFDRQELADFLSSDRSALSFELSKMKRDKLLDYHKNVFVLFSGDKEF